MDKPQSTKEYADFLKQMYDAPTEQPLEIVLPVMKCLSVGGQSAPESEAFQTAVQELYGVAFGIKMGLAHGKLMQPAGYFDYKVPAMDGLWWQTDGGFDMTKRGEWFWQIMLMVPDFVTAELVMQAKDQAKTKHPEVAYEKIELVDFDEGRAVQIMHIGPYATEPDTIAKLDAYVSEHGLKINGKHHEIYLGDPRRSAPDKLKTILRWPVK